MVGSEIWKNIPGYETFYQCSSFGNFRSKDRSFLVTPKTRKAYIAYISRAHVANCFA